MNSLLNINQLAIQAPFEDIDFTEIPVRALLLIDLQNDFCHPDGAFAAGGLRVPDLDGLLAAVNTLVAAARRAGSPVIWVRMVYESEADVGLLASRGPGIANHALRRGTWGAELLSGLEVGADDHFVDKRRFSAFFQTRLERLLRRLEVTGLVVGGVRSDFCVESTVRDAFFRDLPVTVAADATAGFVAELHQASLRVMGTVFADVVDLAEATRRLQV